MDDWQKRQAAHHARVDALVQTHLSRREEGVKHPVADFLFTYYSFRPAQLRRWHPGAGVKVPLAAPHGDWRFYARGEHSAYVDLPDFLAHRGSSVAFVRELLARTAERPAVFGCFGLHEWAMVYRAGREGIRHTDWPLRLGADGTDEVVRTHQLKCTHYDAYRFFTKPVRSLNLTVLQRDSQTALEQPGCLHATMDLYKWAYKLTPLLPSELVVDCFELATEVRVLDMEASPYDLRDLGYDPVRIETPTGKAEYTRRQRAFADRGTQLRRELIAHIDQALSAAGPLPSTVRS
ncbi:3-methyladenine DNA glycosylase [Branchiibius sp. NY16-3462-2]|uniref:3-methyladenine DNA glycosylase n=1 Tax=Branchiibius sp. NY16-3462-2 TaxID=1807500 RepID=UPI00079C1519|nr:3-methyladenine DNA glycosylase [Branchiibius sp. NY16-3462-2]KYH46322.1 3-methyladenine DNA glycosylase [Branchiibius sp. NY16-3462-2]